MRKGICENDATQDAYVLYEGKAILQFHKRLDH